MPISRVLRGVLLIRGGADPWSARGLASGWGAPRRPGQAVVAFGAEEMGTTARGGGDARHAYAHPAHEVDAMS